MSATVLASEVEEKDYVVTYSAEEVTDTEKLIDLALSKEISQIKSTVASYGYLYLNS